MFGIITKILTQAAHTPTATLIGGGLKMVGQYLIVDTVCNRISRSVEEANRQRRLEKEKTELGEVIKEIETIQQNHQDQVDLDQVKENK